MSLADQLLAKSKQLKQVSTVITNIDGKQVLTNNLHTEEQCDVIGHTNGYCLDTSPDDKIHHIADNLYISSQDGAHNFQQLHEHKITHIVNVATGVANAFPNDFQYKMVEILDLPETPISSYFPEIFIFIRKGLEHGSVLIHCNAGISRSSTVATAYLMESKKLSLEISFQTVKVARPSVMPNEGFWKQLMEYELQLK